MNAPRFGVIYDTETTGLIDNAAIPLKSQPHIIELFALKFNIDTMEEVGSWSSLFFQKSLSPEITKITGITQDMLVGQPTFAEMEPSLAEFFLGVLLMGGHNLSYDRDMLSIELRRMNALLNFPWPIRHLCTVEATEHMDGFRKNLTALHEQLFGEPFKGAHRAEADVRSTFKCLTKLVADKVIKL